LATILHTTPLNSAGLWSSRKRVLHPWFRQCGLLAVTRLIPVPSAS